MLNRTTNDWPGGQKAVETAQPVEMPLGTVLKHGVNERRSERERVDVGCPDLATIAATAAGRSRSERLPPWSALLEPFYTRQNLPLPALALAGANELPEPYQRLLVHSCDMTPTLEAFYRQPMRLMVLRCERRLETYTREVLLKTAGAGRAVEYGVIRISLNRLPPVAREAVLEENRPLGNILQTEAIPHLSWPHAFFRVPADSYLSRVLGLDEPGLLYGRRNLLLSGERRLLAEVIEILAPASEDNGGRTGLGNRTDEKRSEP